MKRLCPGSFQYAVIRMDPVAMVEHYHDPIATVEARALRPKKYLVYLDLSLDLPLPESAWFRFQISPIGTTLRPKEPARGIASDMVIPIYPNPARPQGRDPLKPETPFPFHNCYHWIENTTTVRIRRKDDLYDDVNAVKLGARQHLAMGRMFSDDYDRMEAACEVMYANDPVWRAMHPRESGGESDEDDRVDRSRRASHGPRTEASPDSRLSDDSGGERSARPDSRCHEAGSSVNDLLTMDVFNFAHDDDNQFLPLVDLWFELVTHLSEEDIPSPLEFYKERDAMNRIIRAARERNPDAAFPPRNGSLDKNLNVNIVGDESDDDDLSDHSDLASDARQADAHSEDGCLSSTEAAAAGPFSAPSSRPASSRSEASRNSPPSRAAKRPRKLKSGASSRRFSFPVGGLSPSRRPCRAHPKASFWHRKGMQSPREIS